MKRLTLLAMTASALLTAGAAIAVGSAAASSTLPTLSLTATASSITVAGTTQSGAVNVVSTATGVKEAGVLLFLLKPGATFEVVEAAIQKAHGDTNVTSKYGSIVFDAEVSAPVRRAKSRRTCNPVSTWLWSQEKARGRGHTRTSR